MSVLNGPFIVFFLTMQKTEIFENLYFHCDCHIRKTLIVRNIAQYLERTALASLNKS